MAKTALLFSFFTVFLASCGLGGNGLIEEAEQYLQASLTQCGDRVFGHYLGHMRRPLPLEVRGFSARGEALEVTSADSANGIEWKALIRATADVYRYHDGNKWSDWIDGDEGVPLFRIILTLSDKSHGLFQARIKEGAMQWRNDYGALHEETFRPELPEAQPDKCDSFYLRD